MPLIVATIKCEMNKVLSLSLFYLWVRCTHFILRWVLETMSVSWRTLMWYVGKQIAFGATVEAKMVYQFLSQSGLRDDNWVKKYHWRPKSSRKTFWHSCIISCRIITISGSCAFLRKRYQFTHANMCEKWCQQQWWPP